MVTPSQPVGETVSHYRILRKIGGGSMGVVYEAEDVKLGRHTALKFLPDDLANDTQALRRFQREANTPVAVEDIFARVDIERRPGFFMQWTEPNILPATHWSPRPVVLPQIFEQRYPWFECFDVLAHSAFLPPGPA